MQSPRTELQFCMIFLYDISYTAVESSRQRACNTKVTTRVFVCCCASAGRITTRRTFVVRCGEVRKPIIYSAINRTQQAIVSPQWVSLLYRWPSLLHDVYADDVLYNSMRRTLSYYCRTRCSVYSVGGDHSKGAGASASSSSPATGVVSSKMSSGAPSVESSSMVMPEREAALLVTSE